jgi:hypothetical protein
MRLGSLDLDEAKKFITFIMVKIVLKSIFPVSIEEQNHPSFNEQKVSILLLEPEPDFDDCRTYLLHKLEICFFRRFLHGNKRYVPFFLLEILS